MYGFHIKTTFVIDANLFSRARFGYQADNNYSYHTYTR